MITIIGVTHALKAIGLAAYRLNQSDAQKIGLEISPEWEETYNEIYKQGLPENWQAATILEKMYRLSQNDLEVIRQITKSKKWSNLLTDYVVNESSRNREEKAIIARKFRDNTITSFEKTAALKSITGNLYFYKLYKQIRDRGHKPILINSTRAFIGEETKIAVAVREPYLAYRIASEGAELSFIGGAHISGKNNVVTILRKNGLKVKSRNISAFTQDHTLRKYNADRLREYNHVRNPYLQRLQKTHSSWWKKLDAKRTKLK